VALAYLAYQLLSNTELAMLAISMMVINVWGGGGTLLIFLLQGYMGSASLKTAHPSGIPL
jgi:hypothetical protein